MPPSIGGNFDWGNGRAMAFRFGEKNRTMVNGTKTPWRVVASWLGIMVLRTLGIFCKTSVTEQDRTWIQRVTSLLENGTRECDKDTVCSIGETGVSTMVAFTMEGDMATDV
jgi:hypothetical protein